MKQGQTESHSCDTCLASYGAIDNMGFIIVLEDENLAAPEGFTATAGGWRRGAEKKQVIPWENSTARV